MLGAGLKICFIASLALFAALPVVADDGLEKSLRACAAEDNSVKRVTCFDVLVAPIVKAANETASESMPVADKGAWRVSVESSPIDDSKSVYISVKAVSGYADDYQTRMPYLWIRCVENTTALILDFDDDYMSDIAGRGTVTLRVDQQRAFDKEMDVSTDNGSLGLWSGGGSIPSIKALLGGKSLLARAVPVSANPVTIEFPILGIDEAIKPVREACGW